MVRNGAATAYDTASPGRSRGGQMFWGVLLIIAGVLALLMPAVAALATALVFGWLMLLSGVFEIVYAFQTRHRDGFGWRLASGILTLLLGVAIVFLPVAGIASLALLVGAFLFAAGVARTALAFRLRPLKGWGWVLFDGLLSIVVAILVAIGWPASSIGLIGFLTGFTLIFTGLWRLFALR
ncbi:MAG TPA: HdeD family acid-resistance protein [Zeimonas sp.]